MRLYQVLPPLSDADLERLKASIAERGVEVPVIMDDEGDILDGHHRVMIADSLGIEYPKVVRSGLEDHEKRILAVEVNVARRHLEDGQMVIVGQAIEPDIAERARLREVAGKRIDPADNCPQGETRDEVARVVGLGSGKTYERGKRAIAEVYQEAPDILPAIERGTIDLREAKAEVRRRRAVRDERSGITEPTEEDESAPPVDGFRVVLADPPWSYDQRSNALNGTTDRHYQTMTADELMALPVGNVAADDAALVLWTTWPFLPVALRVIEAWGFVYVTGFPWLKAVSYATTFDGEPEIKPSYGVGHWIRGCSEPVLIARRGNLPSPRTNFVGIVSQNARHSKKPAKVYDLAESFGSPRIELFGRTRRPGWTVIGNEVDDGMDIGARLEHLRAARG